ncbi:MAG: hypothetical protein JNG90_14575 [Planctomycetaceae bacterium]|nr:hypothetical protein [Planctomycetaceae bacterium]
MSEFQKPGSNEGPNPGDSSDELLDRVLREARWPEASPEALARLTAVSDSLLAAPAGGHGARRGWLVGSAAAAVLGICVGLAAWQFVHRWSSLRVAESAGAASQLPSGNASSPAPAVVPDGAGAVEPTWRGPTPLEQTIARVYRRGRDLPGSPVENPPQKPEPGTRIEPPPPQRPSRQRLEQRVADALAQLRQDPAANGSTFWDALTVKEQGRAEQLLAERLAGARAGELEPLLRLLSPRASWRLLPALRAAAQREEHRQEVLPWLLRLEESGRLVQVALAEANPEWRRRIYAALWDRPDVGTTALLFQLVRETSLDGEAASALRNAARPPVEWLSQATIYSPLAADRSLAAELLGRLNESEATLRLIELTSNAASRQAAFAALSHSENAMARRFLATAEYDPTLTALIYSQRSQSMNP